jgi:hypothetical protein
MYRKDHLKEWSSAHLASCEWYLDYLDDSTPKSKHGLKEKFEDGCFDKPTSTDSTMEGIPKVPRGLIRLKTNQLDLRMRRTFA